MSDLSDLPDACSPKFQHYYDWTEGMQEVRDAAYSSVIFPSLQIHPSITHKNHSTRVGRTFSSGKDKKGIGEEQ